MLRFINTLLFGILALAANAGAVGLMPTPILNNAKISGDASFDQGSGRYTYVYAVTNPAGNTGEIWDFTIDVSLGSGNRMWNQTYGLTIPVGTNQIDFSVAYSMLASVNATRTIPMPLQVMPFGQVVPPGWNGALGLDSVAHFFSGENTPNIVPGASLGGFQLISYGVPTIRNVQIVPFWMHIVDDHDAVPDADRVEAGKIEQNIVFTTVSLGPSAVSCGSFDHWNQLRDDLTRAIQLGWVADTTLARSLTQQLAVARQSLDAKDFYTAKILLQPMLEAISTSFPAQRTSEGYALAYLNVQSLINCTPNNEIEPKISLTPKSTLLSIGVTQKYTATVIDLANGNAPLSGVPIRFRVDTGPNAGTVLGDTQTDAQGIATITYTSTQTGADTIDAIANYHSEVSYNDTGIVVWSGGADLIVPLFSPPLLITKGGKRFYMSEETQNIGNVMAPPSVTRYYISPTPIVDVTTALAIGERSIPALQPGKSSTINQKVFHMPRNLPTGTYYLAACSDANNSVAELNENNNCSYSMIEGHHSHIVPIKRVNCSNENDGDKGKRDDRDHEEKGKRDGRDYGGKGKRDDKDHRDKGNCYDVDNDLHDDEDGSNGKDDWILGKPFGKAEKKHSDDR